jgi:hypothetical protein
VADAGFHFSFAIRISDAARQSDDAVVCEHVAVERIQRGIVDVRDEHAFAQVVEHHHVSNPAEPAKRSLMQFHPDARTGAKGEQAYRLAAVAERQHEQPRALIAAAGRVADHRAAAVVHLRLFAGRRLDHHTGFRRPRTTELAYEALDALVGATEAVIVHQVLPDGLGVAALAEPDLDHLPVGLAGAGRGTTTRRCVRVGGHLNGRFCRRLPSPPARGPGFDSGGPQVGRRGLAAHTGGPLDMPQRPTQPPQGDDLLLLFFAQDIAHLDGG